MNESLKRKAQKLINNEGNEFLTQLEATLDVVDKLQEVADAIKSIPETVIPEVIIPEQKDVVFPDVQKVELINPPKEKDNKEELALLKEISLELKKKEEYAYDIEIDSTLKEQLRGERGADGLNGKDGTEITANEVALKLESLEGDDRLDISAIKGAEEMVDDIATSIVKAEIKKIPKPTVYMGSRGSTSSGGVQSIVAGTNITVDATDSANPIVSAAGGVSDGDKGDITVSSSGTVWEIDPAVVGITELSATGTPSATTFLRGDNTWATPAGGGGSLTKGIAEVDFGTNASESDIATVTVADSTITSTSYPSVSLYAISTTDHDPDDYMAEGLIPYVTNVVNGVGFDISVRAPNLTFGKYKITYQF